MSRSNPQDRLDPGSVPWDFSSNSSYFEQHVSSPLAGDTTFPDPHDFYRLPSSPTRSADIIVDPNIMTSGTRQRQLHANGQRTTPRPGFRSASGPASSHSSSVASKPTPSLVSTSRPPVRHLVDRFNQPSPPSSTLPSSRYHRSSRTSLGSKPPASMKPLKATSPTSPSRADSVPNKLFKPKVKSQYPPSLGPTVTVGGVSGLGEGQDLAATVMRSPHRQAHQHPVRPTRPALFGEVAMGSDGALDLSQAPMHPGEKNHTLDGSMHRPNAMFPRGVPGRTRSNQEVTPSGELHDLPSVSSGFAAHRKSRSEAYTSTQYPYLASNGHQTPHGEDLQNHRQSPRSKIPIRKRGSGASDSGSSASSRAGSSLSESRYTSVSPPKDSRLPTGPQSRAQAAKSNGVNARSNTPPVTLTSKRYGGTPVGTSNQSSLQAVIRSPLPKTSPPLRNSRSRQPLSAASTSARTTAPAVDGTRSRGTSDAPRSSKSPLKKDKKSPGLGGASFAARRNLFESTSQESLGRPRRKTSNLSSARNSPPPEVRAVSPADSEVMNEHTSGSSYDLVVETHHSSRPEIMEPYTANADSEIDESPVLGMPGQFPETSPDQDVHSFLTSPTPLAVPSLEADYFEDQAFDDTLEGDDEQLECAEYLPGSFDGTSDTPPSRIPQSRNEHRAHTTNAYRETTYPDSPSDRAEAESIRIMLSQTPDQESFQRPWEGNRGSAGPSPLSAEATFLQDEDEESPVDPFASLRRGHGSANEQAGSGSQALNEDEDIPRDITVDQDGYESLKALLEFYQLNDVTDDIANKVREQVRRSISEDLARWNRWSSKAETMLMLEEIIQGLEAMLMHEDSETLGIEQDTPVQHAEEATDVEHTGTAIILEPQRYSKEGISRAPWEQREQQFEFEQREAEDHVMDPAWRTSPDHISAATQGLSAQSRRNQLPEIHATGGGLGLAIKVTSPDEPSPPLLPAKPLYSPPPIPGRRMPPVSATTFHQGHPAHGPPSKTSPPTPSTYNREPGSSVLAASVPDPDNAVLKEPFTDAVLPPSPSKSPATSTPKSSITSRSPSPYPVVTVEKDSVEGKRLTKRRNLLRELYDTEDSYNQDMVILVEIYKDSSDMIMTDEDRKILFSNCDKLREFSGELKEALRQAVKPVYVPTVSNKIWNQDPKVIGTLQPEVLHLDDKRDRDTWAGVAMERSLVQMEQTYGEYIKNHGAANARLLALTNGKETAQKMKTWMDICIEQSNDLTRAWNLDALLVKPTQRILKYPLILAGLLECTPKDHSDYKHIELVQKQLIQISNRINENTKRAELMTQVIQKQKKQENKSQVSTALSRAFARRKVELREQVGLGTAVDDPAYNGIAQRFGGHFFQLQIVMRDVEKYLAEIQSFMDACSCLVSTISEWADVGHTGATPRAPYPELESKWRKYARVFKEIAVVALPEHKTVVQKSVVKPIQTLWKLHDEPQKMMYKRKKKMPEYLRWKVMSEKGEKMDKKIVEAGDLWVAINETLKIELPLLYERSKKLIEAVLKNFIDIQLTWNVILTKKLKTAVEGFQLTGDFTQDILVLERDFRSDFNVMPGEADALGICNRAVLNDTANFLSPMPGPDEPDTTRRPSNRTQSVGSDKSVASVIWSPPIATQAYQSVWVQHAGNDRPGAPSGRYNSASSTSQPYQYPSQLDGASDYSPRNSRFRSSTGGQSSGSTTPRLPPLDASIFPSSRPSTSTGRSDPSQQVLRSSVELGDYRPASGSTYGTTHRSSNDRTSSIFSSAMPMSDSPGLTRPDSPDSSESKDPDVLFLAASLFEFNIAHDRREGGYPYLVYVPGEVFDVLGTKGELWLARNQDDASRKVGWIWEKHFARILPDTI